MVQGKLILIYKFLGTGMLLLFLSGYPVYAQSLFQDIRGQVLDADSQTPVPGVLVILMDSTGANGAVSDSSGYFVIQRVPVGRHSLKFSCMGYNELIIREVRVNSSREVYLAVRLRQSVKVLDEVVISPGIAKDMPVNNMALIGARSFSVEEASRYPVSVDDPLRMAMNYAGVSLTGSDINNEIVIRGNAPALMSWQVEGVQVFNPNHFSDEISSGGAVNILNNNLLDNSDFLLSAWPAEYGNAISGIFDIHLREGNNHQRAYAFQAGILGIDLTMEGPFKPDYGGSYLVNYRYSTLSLYDLLKIQSDNNHTKYQDGAFKFTLPGKKIGKFSIWGFGGTSGQSRIKKKSTYDWKLFNGSAGINHTCFFGNRINLSTNLSWSGRWQKETKTDELVPDSVGLDWRNDFKRNMVQYSSDMKIKFDRRTTIKTGINFQRIFFNALKTEFRSENREQAIIIDGNGFLDLLQLYVETKHNFGNRVTLSTGIRFPYLFYNHTSSLEPRLALKWNFKDNQSLGFGYGLHSQIQSLWVYELNFGQLQPESGFATSQFTNRNLDFTKADHVTVSYDLNITENLHARLEAYYQFLYRIPVVNRAFYDQYLNGPEKEAFGNYSIYNNLGFTDSYIPLESRGTASNDGMEFTLEHFLHNGVYYLITASLFNARYKGVNGKEHDSKYNGNYLFNAVAGKEFRIKNNRTLGLNLRYLVAGGQRYTPVIWIPEMDGQGNPVKDPATGNFIYQVQYDWNRTYTSKFRDYIRVDIGIKYLVNRKKVTHIFSFDIQNLFNRKNILFSKITDFNYEARTYDFEYQYGRLPVFKYRIEF